MARLDPVRIRRLFARTLRTALDGRAAPSQLVDRWGAAQASDQRWLAAMTWDGVGAALGWALESLELRNVAPPLLDIAAADAHDEARTQAVLLTHDLLVLGAEFEAAGIPAIALKGSALLAANYAPALGVRWMNDLDILVPESKLESAAYILESLDYVRGYQRDPGGPESFRPYHEAFTSRDGRLVELHWRLGPQRWGRSANTDAWFMRAEPAGMKGLLVPAAEDMFWHFVLHDARNHAWSTGSLRAAFDLALVARAPGFAVADVMVRLADDPHSGPLLEAIADAAHLSAVIAAEVEPAPEPRYLRLARWRDYWGRRTWPTERVAEAIAWGATLDRVRRHGGWKQVADRALLVVPEAETGRGPFAALRRLFLNTRHAAFVGTLAAAHLVTLPVHPEERRQLRLSGGIRPE
jgi:hypothetical protein